MVVWWQVDEENLEEIRQKYLSAIRKVEQTFYEVSHVRSKLIEGCYEIRSAIFLSWAEKGLMYGTEGNMVRVTDLSLSGEQMVEISCHVEHLLAHVKNLREIDGINLAVKNLEFHHTQKRS